MIEIRDPERESQLQQEILSGHFRDANEVVAEALRALRIGSVLDKTSRPPRQNLAQFLLDSPFAGADLNLERQQDYGRPVDL